MKRRWNNLKPIILVYLEWLLLIIVIPKITSTFFVLQKAFLGPVPWANFDGVHYLDISNAGYRQYLEAFFPLYPLIIGANPLQALLISHVSLVVGLFFLYKLGQVKSIMYLLLFPTSFFFAAVYPESLYLVLSAGTLLAIVKRRWFWAGVLGMFASATRVFGIYLIVPALLEYSKTKNHRILDLVSICLIPVGLIVFMFYLWQTRGDPLAFFHVQPAFGAGRSGSEFIYLPQVVWRYIRIFTTADLSFQYGVALFEFTALIFAIVLLIYMWKQKPLRLYFWYCLAVVITPTLTGTLSSFPRYLLAAFPLFFVIRIFSNEVRYALITLFTALLIYFASAFLQGYFVA